MVVEDNLNTDSSKKIVGSSSDLSLPFGDSSYLHPNGTDGSPIVTIAMTFALRNHNKLGFIDGSCKRDDNNPALANQCDMCNSIIVTWILNSLSSNLFAGAIYVKTASEIWNDLKETYDKVDGSAMFNLHKSINSLNQDGTSVAEYYNNLNSLWKQFDAMVSLPPCTCEADKHFEKHNQLIKLMLFLIGLDESYLTIIINLLTREPLPLVNNAFSLISGEESHRNVTSVETTKPAATAFAAKTFDNNKKWFNNNNFKRTSSISNSNNKGPNPNIKYTNCNKIGHIVDRCFELIGYPVCYVKRNFNSNTRFVSSKNTFADVHSNGVSNNNATTSNSPVSLSNEQLARLMNLLNDNGVSTTNANMAGKNLMNIKGTFFNRSYTVSLLSVHKLSRDSKLFVGFDENNCYIQELKENRTVGMGKQFNCLYLFDIDNACKIVSNNFIFTCYVSKSLWHQRLGHPADQVLDTLKTTLNLDNHSITDHLYETCNKAKQTREPFPLSDHKSTKIGELVHLDVWGPYKITSIDGFRYFLTIVDDFSRAVGVYMLQGKDDVMILLIPSSV
ncbi:ribonuclease H-like domain-containing protein [Tanacetum coccineum]